MEFNEEGRLYRVRGRTVVLKTWRSLSANNLLALGAVIVLFVAATGLAFWLGGSWWIATVVAAALSGYAIWTLYKSLELTIAFGEGTVSIGNQSFGAADFGPFFFSTDTVTAGVDDESGTNVLWLESRSGENIPVATMSLHADTRAIGTRLNALLDESRSARAQSAADT